MRVVCVDTGDMEKIDSFNPHRGKLTFGKIYDVEDSAIKGFYLVEDDCSMVLGYLVSRFISLKEYIKQKINKIYESSVC